MTSGLYYEIIGAQQQFPAPLLFIQGDGLSGTTFRRTPDGRAGWADLLAERGYRSWVTDWPGSGRSGYRDLTHLRYDDVLDGYSSLLRDVICEPVIVVPHSTGGSVAWKLVEAFPHLVAGVVALAAVHPVYRRPPVEMLGEENGVVTFRSAVTGITSSVDRRVPYTHERAYVTERSAGAQFPREAVPSLFAGYQGMSPLMELQRAGIEPGMPSVTASAGFAGKRIRLMAADQDPEHARESELRTVDRLRAWDADADLVWLPDHGFVGNGHYFMAEANSEDVLELFIEQLGIVAKAEKSDA